MATEVVRTRERVRELLRYGFSQQEIADALEVTKSTIAYHARRLGRPADERFNRRYDWATVQQHYDTGHSVRQCAEHFGFSLASWHAAVGRGRIEPRPVAMSIDELVTGPRDRKHLKRRLLAAGLLDPACAICGITDWRGAPLTLELHHVNGVGEDNRLENLTLLCPNCHSQTDTWGGRNRRGHISPPEGAEG